MERPEHIHFFKNMTPLDFLRLLYNSKGIVGNSSVAVRECAYLGVPAVNIGTRQTGRERGRNVIDVRYDRAEILEAIRHHLRNGKLLSDPIYGGGRAGTQIADLLATLPLTTEKRLAY
jgi:UDP-N-acetylglucosamine 2-epimerase